MQPTTEYPGPGPDDYANVLALNTAFVQSACDLKGPQRGRLAAAPFLLFSLRENDVNWWRQALLGQRQQDLITDHDEVATELRGVQTAALGFLWQLARRNAYAARVISGATIAWCETIASIPLLTLLERIGSRGDLITPRFGVNGMSDKRLLDDGVSASRRLRKSLQVAALQSLLTRDRMDSYVRLPAAACSLSGPMRVLEKKV